MNTPLLSVVAPCFNEAPVLAAFMQRIEAACRDAVGESFEILLVNDGSTDDSFAVMRALAERHPLLVVVNLSRNYGHQIALTAGLTLAKGQRVLILDADLQDPPELLPQMMKALNDGADVAFGQRTCRKGDSLFKRGTASCFYRIFGKLADTPMPKDVGDFRLMSRRTVDLLNTMPERSRFIRGMVSWIGLTQIAVPYERAPRAGGRSKYPFTKMVRFAIEAITSFSIVPLRIASYVGAALGVMGLGLLLYVAHAWLKGETVQGWTSLMVVVVVIGSAQLICLGVFGEYLGRLYMESKGRPLFVIESVQRHETSDA